MINLEPWLNDLKSLQQLVLLAIRDALQNDCTAAKGFLGLTNERIVRRLQQMNRLDIKNLAEALGPRLLLQLSRDVATEGFFQSSSNQRFSTDAAEENIPAWQEKLIELQNALLLIMRDALRNNEEVTMLVMNVTNVRGGRALALLDYGQVMNLRKTLGNQFIFRIDDSSHLEMLIARVLDGATMDDVEMMKLGMASNMISANELRV